MLSIRCNSSIKSWKNRKTFWNNKKNKLFINKYKWEGINFSSEKDDWKKFEKNNLRIVLNIFYTRKEKIYPAYA